MKTAERSRRLPSDDQRLRSWGYTIAARPKEGIALWFTPSRRGIVTQEQAQAAIAACVRASIEEKMAKKDTSCKGR